MRWQDIDDKNLTVEKIREDILQMTDLEKIIEATLGRAITMVRRLGTGSCFPSWACRWPRETGRDARRVRHPGGQGAD